MKNTMVPGILSLSWSPSMVLLCFILASLVVTADSIDTISTNRSISDGETLVSGNGTFELGFFSPGASTNRYVGIWFRKPSNRTVVVWVANRNVPINDSSGVLKVEESGRIVVLGRGGRAVWASEASGAAQNPVAQLLDSGNLVVRNGSNDGPEEFLWQSFQHPGDSLLPDMRIGQVGGLELYMSSWKSSDDPATGDYTFQLDTNGLEAKVMRGSVVVYRSGPWNGLQFIGRPRQKQATRSNYRIVVNQMDKYYTYDKVNGSVDTRAILEPNGYVDRDIWVGSTNSWNVYLASPSDVCDTCALCGAYGSCDPAKFPECGCLDGFVPKSEDRWDQYEWSDGCVRRIALDCLSDGFIRYPNLKLPDTENATVEAGMTLEECRTMCSKNCSCSAFSNMNMTDGGTRCFLWYGGIVDIKMLPDNGEDLYVRMASSELDHINETKAKSGSNLKKGVGIASGFTALAISLLLATYVYWKKKQDNGEEDSMLGESLHETHRMEDAEVPHFDFSTISCATDSFSFTNIIGEGGFGPVYKGVLQGGQQVAVKRLSKDSRQGIDEFRNEVKVIAKLQHRNLVKLLGYCVQLEERMLIYEYMPNKSLDYYIFDETRSKSLDWPMRFSIIHGIARGLLYLHQDSRLRIVHRDLKLGNILLDNDMNPKISDFGMARSFLGNESAANTKRVVGTYGYMPPEYAIDGIFSTKSDVFSFGVMVLEIITGRRNRGFNHPNHQLNLLGHAWRLFHEGRFSELIDPSIIELCNQLEVLRSIHVGLLCVQHNPEDRPSMSTVVLMLGGEGSLPQPMEPGFFTARKFVNTETSSSRNTSSSINDVTITTMEVR